MATPKQALPELQQSLEAPAQPVLCGMGLPELGHSDCGGCTVLTPWVPQNYKELELLRQVYYGGIEHEIRKDVWPFLLGHYTFGMSKKEMEQVDAVVAARYQQVLAEWKACEVVVRQREREAHPATRTKFSSGSSIDSHVQRLIHRDSTISNDVFISMDDLEPPGPQDPEDSRPKPEQEAGAGTPGIAAVEQQHSVEFDSPDSGLPSSRNYSMASGIQSSLDEGQSVGFEEEDGAGEEGSSGLGPAVHTFSEPQDPSQEKPPQAGELEAGEELAAVCAAAYTVRTRSPGAVPSCPEALLTSQCWGRASGVEGGVP